MDIIQIKNLSKDITKKMCKIFITLYSLILNNRIYTAVAIITLFLVLLFLKKYRRRNKRGIHKKIYNNAIEEIHYAACYCRTDKSLVSRCITLLEKYPAACNIPMHRHNYTPFLRACWNVSPELISFMISIGADIHATTDAGEGGIYLATYGMIKTNENSFLALKILNTAGLDINLPRYDGYTALHLAASRGRSAIVRWLLAHGANPMPIGYRSASSIALNYGFPKTAAILRLPNEM